MPNWHLVKQQLRGTLSIDHDEIKEFVQCELLSDELHVCSRDDPRHHYHRLVIPLSMFCVCGVSEVHDLMAHDTRPTTLLPSGYRLDARMSRPHGFWLHVPELGRTYYLYAEDDGERERWLVNTRHNLEVLRYSRHAQRQVLEKCWISLFEHGIVEEQDFSAKIPFLKQALLLRYCRPITSGMLEKSDLFRVFLAVERNAVAEVREMIHNGLVDVNEQLSPEMGGLTMLMVAVMHDCEEMIVSVLIPNGADLNVQNAHGDTALIIATRLSRIVMVDEFIVRGADLSVRNSHGETAEGEASGAIRHTIQRHRGLIVHETSQSRQATMDALVHTVLEGVRFEAALFAKKILHLQGCAPFYRDKVVRDHQPGFLLAGPFRSRAPLHEAEDETVNFHGRIIEPPPPGVHQGGVGNPLASLQPSEGLETSGRVRRASDRDNGHHPKRNRRPSGRAQLRADIAFDHTNRAARPGAAAAELRLSH